MCRLGCCLALPASDSGLCGHQLAWSGEMVLAARASIASIVGWHGDGEHRIIWRAIVVALPGGEAPQILL